MSRIAASITMSMSEVDRLKTVQRVVDRMLRVGQAADGLGISCRQVERLVKRYEAGGAAGLADGVSPGQRRCPEGARTRLRMNIVNTETCQSGLNRKCFLFNPIPRSWELPKFRAAKQAIGGRTCSNTLTLLCYSCEANRKRRRVRVVECASLLRR